MATSFSTAVNSISCIPSSPLRSSGGSTLTVASPGHGIPSSVFDNGGWVRVTIVHAGVPKVILKATAAPSSTTLTIAAGTLEGTTDYTCASGDVAELRITAGAFMDIINAIQNLENYTYGITTDYPLYHQNWDSSYSDWNFTPVSSIFTVGTPSLTSGSNALQVGANGGPSYALYTDWLTKSADGTFTFYYKTTGSSNWPVVELRSQGKGEYFNLFRSCQCGWHDNGSSSSWHADAATVSSFNWVSGRTYAIEARLVGSSIKSRIYDRANNLWLKSDGTWTSTPSYATSGTASVLTNGYICIGAAGYAYTVDDVYWDAPAPTLNRSSLTMNQWLPSYQFTAGGFSDPLAGVTWTSSDHGVATITSSGVMSRVANGTVTITATGVSDTTQQATCAVTMIS